MIGSAGLPSIDHDDSAWRAPSRENRPLKNLFGDVGFR
jgi:hypothetical protein